MEVGITMIDAVNYVVCPSNSIAQRNIPSHNRVIEQHTDLGNIIDFSPEPPVASDPMKARVYRSSIPMEQSA